MEKNKSRHGTMRYYLRIDGKRICRLPDDIQSEQFSIEYWKACKTAQPVMARVDIPKALSFIVKPNSFRLCVEYMCSNAFTTLDKSTQDRRRNIMEAMWLEPLSEKDGRLFADMPVSKMDVENLEVLRDRKKEVPFVADDAPCLRHEEGWQARGAEHRSAR
ncbi:hypothetical protein LJR098_002578 [Rhizobium sp. LjRoot98]|uniref:hypothetical protein n=1 Tax=unclassified Rhizobium TaxID=2613769 RepID=UPI0007274E23|nr:MULTISPECIES: hypothetical protein [unclassified Rhizobium]KRC04773.1 hypothetical protein ASE23_06475 [Rhizobium sp. Root73]